MEDIGNTMQEGQKTSTNDFYLMGKQIYQSIRIFFKVPQIVMSTLTIFTNKMHIPAWLVGAFFGLLIASLALFIFAVVTRSQY